MLAKDRSNKEATIERLKQKHRKALEELGLAADGSFPDKLQLAGWLEEKEFDIKSAQKKLDEGR